MQTSLRSIATKAGKLKLYRFQNLYGMLDEKYLKFCFTTLNKKSASGVDGVTHSSYGETLDDNVERLVGRLKAKNYRAKLVRRKYIPKGGGKLRPLGIPVLEDKLLQSAVARILGTIWEEDFLPSNCGYRPRVGAKTGVNKLLGKLRTGKFNYVVEADIKGFFNNIDHDWLIRVLELRVDDSALIGLIRKWLKAGVLEDKSIVVHPTTGTPQGGVISPVLANIYLHYVLDLWFQKVVYKHCSGKVFFVRYADDFVCLFQNKADADKFYKVLPKRMGKFGLELAPDKTQILSFKGKPGKERFTFLGFEFYRGWTKGKKISAYARTSPKKMTVSLKLFKEWIQQNRSLGTRAIFTMVRAKLRGHYNYFGISGNAVMLFRYYYLLKGILRKYLNRRSQRRSCNWEKFQKWLSIFNIPSPRITWTCQF